MILGSHQLVSGSSSVFPSSAWLWTLYPWRIESICNTWVDEWCCCVEQDRLLSCISFHSHHTDDRYGLEWYNSCNCCRICCLVSQWLSQDRSGFLPAGVQEGGGREAHWTLGLLLHAIMCSWVHRFVRFSKTDLQPIFGCEDVATLVTLENFLIENLITSWRFKFSSQTRSFSWHLFSKKKGFLPCFGSGRSLAYLWGILGNFWIIVHWSKVVGKEVLILTLDLPFFSVHRNPKYSQKSEKGGFDQPTNSHCSLDNIICKEILAMGIKGISWALL